MKIKALKIKTGDRITAYFKNKMQVCTVRKFIASKDKSNIILSVFIGERYRYSSSGSIHFKSEAMVDLID